MLQQFRNEYHPRIADTVSSLAGRLARIERMLTPEQKKAVAEKLGGTTISQLVKNLFHAIDGEAIEQKALELTDQQPGTEPGDYAREKAQQQLVADFETFYREHQDRLDALTLFYQQPQRRQEITLAQIKDVLAALKQAAPRPAPRAAPRLGSLRPPRCLAREGLLTHRADRPHGPHPPCLRHRWQLSPFSETVRRNFQTWIMRRHAGIPTEKKFTEITKPNTFRKSHPPLLQKKICAARHGKLARFPK